MNERIRQLAEQACAFADIQYNKQTRATFYTNKSVEEFFREKFAELIVRECAVYCEGHILPKRMAEENDLNYNDGVMDCAIGLKQHFGVEE
jgi:hypothetical protein